MLVVLTLLFLYGTVAIDPSLSVPPCLFGPSALIGSLVYTNGSGGPFPHATHIWVCWNQTGVIMQWEAEQDNIIRNDYSSCNDPIYNQEVVQIVIGSGYDTPYTYRQIAISPFGVVFLATVNNPHFDGTDMTVTPVGPCSSVGLRVDIDIIKDEWDGEVVLPWTWLLSNSKLQTTPSITASPNSGKLPSGVPENWRANFFRIAMRNSVSNCTMEDCDYGAWNPTGTNTFDISYAMGGLVMLEGDIPNSGAFSIGVTGVLPVFVLLLLQMLL
jgi:hypothetical protein